MRKFIIPMLVLTAWATSLPAQITQEQANEIVLQHINNEVTPPYLLYVNVNAPSEAGIAVTTFQEEVFQAKYACWAYYLNENPDLTEPARHRYLFVKENDGNLLEVITNNDLGPEDLTQWTSITGLVDMEGNSGILIYPNPTSGELRIMNYELRIENIEIFDMMGKLVFIVETHGRASLRQQPTSTIDISSLPSGVYFIRIQISPPSGGLEGGGTVTQKIVKQ